MLDNQFALDFIMENNVFEANRTEKVYKARRNQQEIDSYQLFRFSDENISFLSNEFLVDRDDDRIETRGGALDKTMQMKTFLRYVSDPGFQVELV